MGGLYRDLMESTQNLDNIFTQREYDWRRLKEIKMSKTWKWILGIVFVMVLVGAMFAIGFMWQSHMSTGWAMPLDRDWNSPMPRQWNQQMPYSQNHPMMNTRNFTPFGGFAVLGGLVRLALFFGLLYGAYWLGRRNARIAIDPKPAARELTSAPPKTPEKDS
jgi:hypothetical protein